MGCCSSTAAAAKDHVNTEHTVLTRGVAHGAAKSSRSTNTVREPTVSEKRQRAAEAAETRQTDWRQGGSTDPDKAKALRVRREKDELLGRIYNRYTVLGKEPPIGLPSCDIEQLKRHLETLK